MHRPGARFGSSLLLAALLGFATTALATTPAELERVAARTAAAVDYLHARLRSNVLHAAHDRAVSALLATPGCDARARSVVERTLIGIHGLLPVELARVVDRQGVVQASVLRGYTEHVNCDRVTPPAGPGSVEASGGDAEGTVLPSPDAGRWVASYSAVVRETGRVLGRVSSDADLALFRRALPRVPAPGLRVRLVDAQGFVVADTELEIPTRLQAGRADPAHYFVRLPDVLLDPAVRQWRDGSGRAVRVARSAAGPWTVVASATE